MTGPVSAVQTFSAGSTSVLVAATGGEARILTLQNGCALPSEPSHKSVIR